MLMIHPPPASSCSPFHVPQVFLLHFPSSSATAAFPQVWYHLLFSLPPHPRYCGGFPILPYLVFKTLVAIVVVVLLLLLLLLLVLLSRQSSSVGNLTWEHTTSPPLCPSRTTGPIIFQSTFIKGPKKKQPPSSHHFAEEYYNSSTTDGESHLRLHESKEEKQSESKCEVVWSEASDDDSAKRRRRRPRHHPEW
jgi:hypothetical protein